MYKASRQWIDVRSPKKKPTQKWKKGRRLKITANLKLSEQMHDNRAAEALPEISKNVFYRTDWDFSVKIKEKERT